jgi:hypothetical protein
MPWEAEEGAGEKVFYHPVTTTVPGGARDVGREPETSSSQSSRSFHNESGTEWS